MNGVCQYLDDFLVIGAPNSDQCMRQLQTLLAVFDYLNIPVAMEKLEGPTMILTFLGIELDTQALTLLPADKLTELKGMIISWTHRKACTKRNLQSLVGKLQHASRVVRPGRSFLRRMFELLKGVSRKQHFIRLNRSFHSDLRWWLGLVERSGNDRIPRVEPDVPPVLRCIRQLRLWSLVGPVLVAASVASGPPEVGNCSERALSNCGCSNGMG